MSTDDEQRGGDRWSAPGPGRGWTQPTSPAADQRGERAANDPYATRPQSYGAGQDPYGAGQQHHANPQDPYRTGQQHHASGQDAQDPYGTRSPGSSTPASFGSQPYARPDGDTWTFAAPSTSAPGSGGAGGGPQGHQPRSGRGRRRPGWAGVVAAAVGAAMLGSLGTAGLTGAFEEDPPSTQPTAQQNQQNDPAPADPVVTSTTEDPDWANVAAAVRPSVVAIDVQVQGGSGAGSGVIIDEEGHILTNNHVVGGAADGGIVVTLSDGRMFEATIAGTDAATDLAVITLTDPPDDLQPATLGDSEEVIVGDPVAAVGNPLGLSSTVTTGIVSALDRPVTTTEDTQVPGQPGTSVVTNAIQVDAAINPGNSGGPLFDATGRVIGITSSIASLPSAAGGSSGSIGLGFAIPVNLAKQVADQLVENGVAEHAFLGVRMTDGTATVDGATRTGARVESVDSGTPAEQAGLQPGDVITAIDGDTVSGAEALTGFVRQYASGDQVTLTVARDGETVEITATLATREDTEL
ncbi:trypsin-like peptidase domain-containing protein [Georgenia sp. TF02-10]|uniref:S1C family serine protease n=1 Tax=Georgenia sp. TF02-10 TaxID=2917725 RepID=UPI001FA7B9B4|nr:trypsin-like peptidase domain-containing protein [Georgenia sp. TF02-10]UNX54422.1 trypsin-like peptidase domain-containing protein [Georgenia sp. TF02-10]